MAVDRSRLPAVGEEAALDFPDIARHRLANGLEVRTVEHRALPVVTFVALVRGGVGADPTGGEGLAALTADMLDEGTGAESAIDVSERMARIGADYDVDVRDDSTLLTLTTLSRFADRGAALLADLVQRPSLRDDDFTRVRTQRINRLTQLKDSPAARGEQALLHVLYGDHPYGHLAIGRTSTLQRLTTADVAAFHAAVYRPARTTLVVAGDGSHRELLAVAEHAFGGWEARGADATHAPESEPVPAAPATRLGLVHREHAAQSILAIGQLSPPRSTPDYAPLVALNAALGGQFVSRVNLKLREQKAYTYGARTGFSWRRGPGIFTLETSVETRVTVDALADALAELDAVRGARPITDAELAMAKASLTRGYGRNFETAGQVARSTAQLALFELPDTYFEHFVPMVEAVTAADVARVARQHLDPARMAAIVVGDREAIAGPLASLGLGTPTDLGLED
ncbi:MAG: M16 family metallopeptidase [Vicinamibacterales bacterium]